MQGFLIRWLIRGKPTKTHILASPLERTRCGIDVTAVTGERIPVNGGIMCKRCNRRQR